MARSLFARLARRYRPVRPLAERTQETAASIRRADTFFPLELDDRATLVRKRLGSVGIVGGGFAGLTAGWFLAEHGFAVTVFEALDRVGGRVWTARDPRTRRVLELGAELIGRDHQTWLRLARQFSLPLTPIGQQEVYDALKLHAPLVIDGKPRSSEVLFEELDRVLARLNRDAAQVNPYHPWEAKRAAEWDKRPVSDWIKRLRVSRVTKAALRFELENLQCVPVERQSYLALLAPVSSGLPQTTNPRCEASAFWEDSEVFRCAIGNDALAERLSDRIVQAGGEVRLRHRVDGIASNSAGAELTVKGRPRPFDWVIVTAPPSAWPSAIPEELEDWRCELGAAAKYQLDVRTRFWIDDHVSPTGMSDSIGIVWESTSSQNLPERVPVTMTVFLGGPRAAQASRAHDPRAFCDRRLRRMYKGLTREQFVKRQFVNWVRKRNFNGGYSCPAPGEVCGVIRQMQGSRGRLYVAGERAAMPFYGYMEGALYTGLRVAHLIAARAGSRAAEAKAALRKADSATWRSNPIARSEQR